MVTQPLGDRGHETVLVVDDEEAVRRLATVALVARGYQVLDAADGASALERAESVERIDVLVTDLALPGMSGQELVAALRARRPTLKVVFMSGYAPDVLDRQTAGAPRDAFLDKPFSTAALARTVRDLLDA